MLEQFVCQVPGLYAAKNISGLETNRVEKSCEGKLVFPNSFLIVSSIL